VRPLVVTPTYQEADNIAEFLSRARAAVPDADILVDARVRAMGFQVARPRGSYVRHPPIVSPAMSVHAKSTRRQRVGELRPRASRGDVRGEREDTDLIFIGAAFLLHGDERNAVRVAATPQPG
jgi:hypothetical protein